MLFIGVDSENKTVVFAQGFFSDESTETFEWALNHNIWGAPRGGPASFCGLCLILIVYRTILPIAPFACGPLHTWRCLCRYGPNTGHRYRAWISHEALSVSCPSQGDHHGLERCHDSRRRTSSASHPAPALSVARDEKREETRPTALQADLCSCFRCFRGCEYPQRSARGRATRQPRGTLRVRLRSKCFRAVLEYMPGSAFRALSAVFGRHVEKPGRGS